MATSRSPPATSRPTCPAWHSPSPMLLLSRFHPYLTSFLSHEAPTYQSLAWPLAPHLLQLKSSRLTSVSQAYTQQSVIETLSSHTWFGLLQTPPAVRPHVTAACRFSSSCHSRAFQRLLHTCSPSQPFTRMTNSTWLVPASPGCAQRSMAKHQLFQHIS